VRQWLHPCAIRGEQNVVAARVLDLAAISYRRKIAIRSRDPYGKARLIGVYDLGVIDDDRPAIAVRVDRRRRKHYARRPVARRARYRSRLHHHRLWGAHISRRRVQPRGADCPRHSAATAHVTAVFPAPVTVAVNCCVCPAATETVRGDTVTVIPPAAGESVSVTVPTALAFAALVAVKVPWSWWQSIPAPCTTRRR